MLDIIDINSSAENLSEIAEIKESFRTQLKNVKHGTVLIINNFPAHELVDYLIIINIEKEYSNNYHRIFTDQGKYYLDNAVCAIIKYQEYNITNVDEKNIYCGESSFDYCDANKTFNNDLKTFFKNYNDIWCHTIFNVSTKEDISHHSPEIIINQKINAERIIASVSSQQTREYPKITHIRAFTPNVSNQFDTEIIQKFAENIISSSSEKFEYGILTKKKLELIANRKNKIIDNIHEHIGSSINIISGKAGTGKTIYLAKSIYRLIGENHRARFLTFNHLLIKDIKVLFRGYGSYNVSNFSSSTLHQYFYKLTKVMGIDLLFSERRINELIDVCSIRFDKFKPTFDLIKNREHFSEHFLIEDIQRREKDKSDYPEFREIAIYFKSIRDFRDWHKIKDKYLVNKREILQMHIGTKVFVEDYPKILETLYLSITDTSKFYNDFNISNRYELLSFIYDVDKLTPEKNIPYENVEKQVKKLKRSANWSIIFVDEAQDCEQYEKEILFELRGSENIVIASGGKEQLIRTSGVRLWNLSFGRKIPHNINKLYGSSFRQKENIIQFVNVLASEYKINLQLKSHVSSKGVGKIILDIRNEDFIYDIKQIDYLLKYGKLNECSVYESLMILVTSKYIDYEMFDSFNIDVTDHIEKVKTSTNRTLKEQAELEKQGFSIWSGVSENKSQLEVPYQNQTRILSYDSCRGIEAWSVMCLDIDGFIDHKRKSDEAKTYLNDDLFLSEEERKDKYAITWLLMAFTRPIDTLYLDLRKRNNLISKRIVEICERVEGVEILR